MNKANSMHWRDFKAKVETAGVKDDTLVRVYTYGYDTHLTGDFSIEMDEKTNTAEIQFTFAHNKYNEPYDSGR